MCREFFQQEKPVVMAKEWFNDEEIWLMFIGQLTRGPFISCESANCVAQITPDNRDESFSGDRAVVSDNYRRLSRRERSGESPHKRLRVAKNCLDDKQNSLGNFTYSNRHVLLTATL
jgi:hypothetical protein